MRGSRPRELPGRLQHAQAEVARAGRGRVLKSLLRPVQPEFRILAVPILAVRLDKPASDQHHGRARHKVADGRVLRRMRKQAQRQAGGLEQRDSRAVAKQPRNVARIGVAQSAQLLVITTDERRTAANAATQDRTIHLVAQFDHGGGFVEVFAGEKNGRKGSERLLHGDQDFTRVRPQAGDVQQHEQHARRPHPQEFIEIAGHALPGVDRGNLGVTQRRRIAMERVGERRRGGARAERETP